MRHNSKNLISVAVLGSFLLLLGACAESELTADSPSGALDENGLATVAIDVSIENTSGGTRTDYDYTQDPTQSYISTGQEIDALIYAVYQITTAGTDTTFTLQEYFSTNSSTSVDGIKKGDGQLVDAFSAEETKHITLKVDPELDYRVVFWAQSASCNAYTTTDFEKIEINYANAKNNDETRDAFCGWVDLLTKNKNDKAKAVLRRPFAQINVGTTGADYKNLIYDPNLLPNGITITQSTMTVTGVADEYNALTGEATISKESKNKKDSNGKLVAEFAYSWLPAWIKSGKPTADPSSYLDDDKKDTNPYVKIQTEENQQAEEFLKVKLNNDDEPLGAYKTDYPTLTYKYKTDDEGNKTTEVESCTYLTETFKYMSMCYVLAPSTNKERATVTVNYTLHQKKSDGDTDPIPLAEKTLNNVPVQANWRTNILHGLYGEKDDPTSIFSGVTMPVILQTNFDYHYVNTDITDIDSSNNNENKSEEETEKKDESEN